MITRTDPQKMDKISKTTFKDIYPLIACQIIKRCKIKKGIGIDIGSGSGALAIALAKITDLKIYSLDISSKTVELAKQNIKKEKLQQRIFPIKADVHQLPFSNNSIDLVVSRGSMFFWEDKEQCFREINRVLKHSGLAYIGCGFGSIKLKNKIKKSDNKKKNSINVNKPKIKIDQLEKTINNAKIHDYEIINDSSGLWVIIIN